MWMHLNNHVLSLTVPIAAGSGEVSRRRRPMFFKLSAEGSPRLIGFSTEGSCRSRWCVFPVRTSRMPNFSSGAKPSRRANPWKLSCGRRGGQQVVESLPHCPPFISFIMKHSLKVIAARGNLKSAAWVYTPIRRRHTPSSSRNPSHLRILPSLLSSSFQRTNSNLFHMPWSYPLFVDP
jgi:hypothetical protein